MYDAATMTMKSPAIADLAGTATADFPQEDFDQLGIAVGATVRLTVADGASTASSITVVAQPVQGVTRGTVVVAANLRGAEVNALLRVDRPVTDVRVDKI